jgi:hypothetical protein
MMHLFSFIAVVKDRYDAIFQSTIDACQILTLSDIIHMNNMTSCTQLQYDNKKEFIAIADALEIMNDLKVSRNECTFHR